MFVRNFLMNVFYHPVLFFFLLPLFYMSLGSVFSLQYNPLNYLSIIILYLFILSNQMLENMFLRIPQNDFQLSKRFVFLLETLTVLALLFFGWRHSWTASLVLLLFSAIIQLQFLFSYYDLDYVAVLVTTFFKVILLNGFSFYIGTQFIHTRFIPYYFGLFIPFFLYEAARIENSMRKVTLTVLVSLGYIVSIVLLWQHLAWGSLLLLLTLPFAWLVISEYNRKTTASYAIMTAILYIGLIGFELIS